MIKCAGCLERVAHQASSSDVAPGLQGHRAPHAKQTDRYSKSMIFSDC